jgi:hypothetical protein
MMYAAASLSVTIGRPFRGLIGSSKGRDQGNQQMPLLKLMTPLQFTPARAEWKEAAN